MDESFGARADERFEERQEAYNAYRRAPGQSMAAYISTIKRLRSEYLKEDPDTKLSDKSFAQRLLSRAALTKRERMDIFYSAGGVYNSAEIEKVLRFRCQNIHLDEKKPSGERPYKLTDNQGRSATKKKNFVRRSDRTRPHRASHHSSHLAEPVEPNEQDDRYEYEDEDEEDADNEDLEQEAMLAEENEEPEDYDEEEDWDDEEYDEEALKEAYAAGWRAKSKTADSRKGRGYHQAKSKGQGKGKQPDRRKAEDRKKNSQCASCKQYGHWHGDAVCPNVISGKDPPRSTGSASQGGTHYTTSQEGDPADRKSEGSGGTRVHRVNWTFPVNSVDGWGLLQNYDTEESEEDDDGHAPENYLGFSAGRQVEPRQSNEKTKKYRMALKTVLEALIEEETEESMKTRLRKKEYKSAREEEARQFSAAPDKRNCDGLKPMEVDLNPQEILRILPHLSREEKKSLYKALRKDAELFAADNVPREEEQDKLARPDKRSGYSSQPRPKASPKEAASSASAAASSSMHPPAPKEEEKIPEAVRKKRLKQFRQQLYENSLDKNGRVRLSEASDIPDHNQDACPHEMNHLRWGANSSAHWATCKKCGLKKVLYYSMEHGALVADPEVWMINGGAVHVILDTGCRTAVAGSQWHETFQDHLRKRGLHFFEVEHTEVFRFGAGEPVMSTRAFVYPVVLGESQQPSWLRLAEVANTRTDHRVAQCPALVGPSEMARWGVEMNFGSGQTVVAGHSSQTQLSETRHPVLKILGEAPKEAWQTPQLEQLKERLIKDPFSLALLQAALEEESDSSSTTAVVPKEESPDETEEFALWQSHLEDEAISCLDFIPQEALINVAAPPREDEPSDGSFSEGESETSHGSGPDVQSTESESSDEERDYSEILASDLPGETEILNKGQRRRLLDATQKVSDAAETEATTRKSRRSSVAAPRKPGPWRLVEIFTWTCMLTKLACEGGWSTYEPITLDSGWNLEHKCDRDRAFKYLEEIDPDAIAIAWPCGPWSILQNANGRTALQRRALQLRRIKARRTLLKFVKEVTLWQRRRGRIVIGENPQLSGAWRTPEIEEAFSGTAQIDFDQCMLGLRHPISGVPMRKRTRMRGDPVALEYIQKAQCDGTHEHHPIEGGFRHPDGHWMSVSSWAGGYAKPLCKALLKGFEKRLSQPSQVYMAGEEEDEVPEIMDGQEAVDEEEDIEDELEKEFEREHKEEERFPEHDPDAEEHLEDEERHPVNAEVRKAVEFAHRQLGHPSTSTLLRMLKLSGANADAVRYAKKWKCSVCEARRAPRHPQAATASTRPFGFNRTVQIDVKYAWDARGKKYAALSLLDTGSGKHDAHMIKTRRSDYIASKILRKWIMPYGTPQCFVHDQGGEFEGAFVALLEQFSISSRVTGAHSPWQLGVAERHGGLLGQALQAIVDEHGIEGYRQMKEALSCACMAKNATVTRDGFTPNQRVFGSECRWPSLAEENPGLSYLESLDTETEAARAHRMRITARVALVRQDVQDKMRRAILRKPAVSQGPFVPGCQVYFWVPTQRARYKPGGTWRGPATVLVKEATKRYFISWRGRLLLVSEENLRLGTKDELALNEPVREEVVELQGVLRDPMRSNTYQDLRSSKPPPRRPRRRKPAAPDTEERKAARKMLRGSKAVSRLLKQGGLHPRVAPRKRKQAEPGRKGDSKKAATAEPMREEPGEPAQAAPDEETEEVEKNEEAARSISYEPSILDDTEAPGRMEVEPHEVPVPEDHDLDSVQEAARQEWDQLGEERRRRFLMDDVPLSIKKRMAAEEETLPNKRQRINASWIVQAMAAASEGGPSNEWVSRYELEVLRKLTGLPVSAARIHRQPRKKLMRPPKLVSRSRLSILIGEDPKDAYVVEENEQDVRKNPRRKAGFYWRGMTMLIRNSKAAGKLHATYIELPTGIYKAFLTEQERCSFETLWTEEIKDILVQEVMLLRLRQNGKELDPKWFNQEEQAAFRESDRKEWQQWIDNKVVRKVTREEEKTVPKHQVFKAPLRMVRVNKAQSAALPLIAKSRLVVPGHRDPGLGQFRTDAPTTSPVATRMAKGISQARGWTTWAFDITTAFLSGEATERRIFVRAPQEGLPTTEGMGTISGGELLQILKSAYGLTEAPRLWYLKAIKSLAKTPLQELSIAKATFAAADSTGTWAILCLHVDDGLLMGAADDPRFKALKEQINGIFNIKAWQQIPMTFLGVEMKMDGDVLIDSMRTYIEEIKVPDMIKQSADIMLSPEDLTKYRQLVMRLRWPAQQVMPHVLYEISKLAQRVSGATYQDFQDAVKLHQKILNEAASGRASLKYPKLDLKKGERPCMVSYFDASLGKEKDGKSQLGNVHFMTSEDALHGPRPAIAIDFNTTKSTRVVRSSMAAESASLSVAIDRHLYNRLLLQMLWDGPFRLSADWRKELKVKGYVVTDAKSLYDHLQTTGQIPAERQTMLDLMVARDFLEQDMFVLKWVPTHRQYADGLTKSMRNLLWEEFCQSQRLSLKETPKEAALEAHRQRLRKEQRQRRKEKFAVNRQAQK